MPDFRRLELDGHGAASEPPASEAGSKIGATMEKYVKAIELQAGRETEMDAETLVAEAKSSLMGLLHCLDLHDEALQSTESIDLFAILHFNSMQADVLESAIGKMEEACFKLEGIPDPGMLDKN